MTFTFLVAPDFAPERFAGWHMLNTALQKRAGIHLHLLTPASAAEPAVLLTLYYRGKPTVTARCATRREAAKRWVHWHAALSGSGVSWNVTTTTL